MLSDIGIKRIEVSFKEEKFRVPLMFGTGVIESITLMTAKAIVENGKGKAAEGYGNILLSDIWGFPSDCLSHEERDRAMRQVGIEYAGLVENFSGRAHPIDIYWETKDDIGKVAVSISQKLKLKEEVPLLAALVCSSPVDAALHDAFGKVNEISTYDCYGHEFMAKDLSCYLGPRYKGRYISHYLGKEYTPSLPIWHLVGGMDKLKEDEVDDSDPKDGLPVSLEEWIRRDGIFCLKIKLKGTDLRWDIERTKKIAEVARNCLERTGNSEIYFSIDTNEQCENPDYVIEYLRCLEREDAAAFQSLLYVEQPTERDLDCHSFDMRKLASIKPVLADEGITGLNKFELAKELGWSGVALKTCKGHSSALLYVARCEEEGMLYSVQDLTNPGLSLIHSVGLAGRTNPIKGVEYNSRQYIPWANEEMQGEHESLFRVREGMVLTESIGKIGLGY